MNRKDLEIQGHDDQQSGGTISDKGREARDVMLGLAKTCMKLKVSFYHYLGVRLGIVGPQIPHLANLIRSGASTRASDCIALT